MPWNESKWKNKLDFPIVHGTFHFLIKAGYFHSFKIANKHGLECRESSEFFIESKTDVKKYMKCTNPLF